jgi:hypothetical protein
MEEKLSGFKKYVYQTIDLMVDAMKWKLMAQECDNEEMKRKYMSISDTLYDMFMIEHNNIGAEFKKD